MINKETASAAGIAGYLEKPFRGEELVRTMSLGLADKNGTRQVADV